MRSRRKNQKRIRKEEEVQEKRTTEVEENKEGE
jgi:hypothetical protein